MHSRILALSYLLTMPRETELRRMVTTECTVRVRRLKEYVVFFFLFFFATGMTFQNAALCLSALQNANRREREKFSEEPDLLDLFRLTFNRLRSTEYDTPVIPKYYTLVW